MRYTADAITRAAQGVGLRIGPADHTLDANRSWRGRVHAWWVRRCRSWTARPLSVPQMLRLQAAASDPVAYLVTLIPLLRAVLPKRWWYRFVGDPVRLILRLPPTALQAVLRGLLTVQDRDVSRETEDPLEELRRLQRRAVYGDEGKTGAVSLLAATMSVRATYGEAWYFDPRKWPTSDGYAPFAVALVEYAGVQALEVRRRLEVADGYSLAHAKPHERDRMQRMAYPQEVC